MADLIDADRDRARTSRSRLDDRIDALLFEREQAGGAFFEHHAEGIARLCHRMAERFARDGRLVAFGGGPADRSDARHVAVEFVHPVIVGKRALPALGLAHEGGPLAAQVMLEVEPDDITIAFGADFETIAATAAARVRGCLTIAFSPDSGAEWEFVPGVAGDEFIGQELVETLMLTIAMVGYDGGAVARDGLADHVTIAPSEHIPHIQEAHASAYHALRELVELADPALQEAA